MFRAQAQQGAERNCHSSGLWCIISGTTTLRLNMTLTYYGLSQNSRLLQKDTMPRRSKQSNTFELKVASKAVDNCEKHTVNLNLNATRAEAFVPKPPFCLLARVSCSMISVQRFEQWMVPRFCWFLGYHRKLHLIRVKDLGHVNGYRNRQ